MSNTKFTKREKPNLYIGMKISKKSFVSMMPFLMLKTPNSLAPEN